MEAKTYSPVGLIAVILIIVAVPMFGSGNRAAVYEFIFGTAPLMASVQP